MTAKFVEDLQRRKRSCGLPPTCSLPSGRQKKGSSFLSSRRGKREEPNYDLPHPEPILRLPALRSPPVMPLPSSLGPRPIRGPVLPPTIHPVINKTTWYFGRLEVCVEHSSSLILMHLLAVENSLSPSSEVGSAPIFRYIIMLPSAWGTRRVPRSSRCASIPAKRTTATPYTFFFFDMPQTTTGGHCPHTPQLLSNSQKNINTEKKKLQLQYFAPHTWYLRAFVDLGAPHGFHLAYPWEQGSSPIPSSYWPLHSTGALELLTSLTPFQLTCDTKVP
ncbi:hypothetical protein J6590_088144 [Homalodisca vitripennis]|nr:hypothetical protein J6590_088144 [Homalodisca vitripennis]